MLTLAVAGGVLQAQSPADWRKVGLSAVELSLASPATGPVERVWFSSGGSVLYARTRSGKVFQTADFEIWTVAEAAPDPPAVFPASAVRLPENGAAIIDGPGRRGQTYALGRNLFRSDDGGRTWQNLTAFKTHSVVGSAQHSVAISPTNPEQIVVANDYGVWRSMDGGSSWSGLNQLLPNLPVRRILSTPGGIAGVRIAVDGMATLELPPGGSVWLPAPGVAPDPDGAARDRYSMQLGAYITATAASGDTVYAGAADGRLWVSIDRGQTFQLSTRVPAGTSGMIERLYVDATEPWVALAALSGRGPHVLRTTTAGNTWDALDGNLPVDASAHGITADRVAGAVYVATDKGVFFGRTDLENPSGQPVNWNNLTDSVAPAGATDVRLDAAGVQLYAALDGYGVYAARAPHVAQNWRIVSSGDFSTRPAAPGSLLSVIGGRVDAAIGDGISYPLLASSDVETQIQVPFDVTGTNVSLSLRTSTGTVTRALPVQPVSPAILVTHEGAPMLWDAESGLPLDLRNLARSNGRVQIWATGLGKVRPDWPTGMRAPAEDPPKVIAEIRAYLDKQPLTVTRATLVPGYVGFYLIEVQLPPVLNAGTSELYISADTSESNRVQLNIEP